MRRIGRLRSEASPSKRRGDGVAADDAHHQPHAGAGIAEIERLARRQQRADAAPCDAPAPSPRRSTSAPSARQAAPVRSTSSPSSRPSIVGLADAEKAENQGAVRDRFVARRPHAAAQGPLLRAREARRRPSSKPRVPDRRQGRHAPLASRCGAGSMPAAALSPKPSLKLNFHLTGAVRITNRTKSCDGGQRPAAAVPSRGRSVAKPELGNKHQCQNCGASFFDLNKIPSPARSAARFSRLRRSSRAAQRAAAADDDEPDPVAGAELVTLEDADADADKIAVVVDDDVEIEVADDTFLEEEEEDGDDVVDLIDGEPEDDEER